MFVEVKALSYSMLNKSSMSMSMSSSTHNIHECFGREIKFLGKKKVLITPSYLEV